MRYLAILLGVGFNLICNAQNVFSDFEPHETQVITTAQENTRILWWGVFSQSDKFQPLKDKFQGVLTEIINVETEMLGRYIIEANENQRGLLIRELKSSVIFPEYALYNSLVANRQWYVRVVAQTVSGTVIPFVIKVKQEKTDYQLAEFKLQDVQNELFILTSKLSKYAFKGLTAIHPDYSEAIQEQFRGCRITAKNNIVDIVCLVKIVSEMSSLEIDRINEELQGLNK